MEQNKKVLYIIKQILKDTFNLTIQSLIVTILLSVCVENGWLFTATEMEINNEMFWSLHSFVFLMVPFIIFVNGITGKYKVDAIICKIKVSGNAKLKDELD